jgi:hypothetical protein
LTDREAWLHENIEKNFFDEIEKCMKSGAYFAAALALSAYTDAMGGLINGTLTETRESKKNYCTFLEQMGYSDCRECIYFYRYVRSGLVHQYFIKGKSMLSLQGNYSRGLNNENGEMIFIIEKYFCEFKEAYEKYKQNLLSGKGNLQECFDRSIRRDQSVTTKVDNALILKDGATGKTSISIDKSTESIHEENCEKKV